MMRTNPRLITGILIVVALGTVACSREPAGSPAPSSVASVQPVSAPAALPGVSDASSLIAGSAEFGDFQFTLASFSLPMKGSMMNEPARIAANDLRAAGWIRFDAKGNVALSEKAKSDKRWLVRQNDFVELVPLAKKELVKVNSVSHAEGGDAVVDFTWRWIPNEVGASFKSGLVKERFDASHRATATLKFLGGKWQVFLITATESGPTGKQPA